MRCFDVRRTDDGAALRLGVAGAELELVRDDLLPAVEALVPRRVVHLPADVRGSNEGAGSALQSGGEGAPGRRSIPRPC